MLRPILGKIRYFLPFLFFFFLGTLLIFFYPLQKMSLDPTSSQPPREVTIPKPLVSGVPSPSIPPLPSPQPDACTNLYALVCQGQGVTVDPTGVVNPDVWGEKQVSHLYSEITRKNPDFSVEEVNDLLVQKVYRGKRRLRLETAFKWVKTTMERFIEKQPERVFSAREKKEIKSRIHKTILELPPPASIYGDEPDLFMKPEALYERTPSGVTRIRIGGAYLFIANSWFNVVFTLAHELGHVIDPCEIRAEGLAFPAYDRLTACLLYNELVKTLKTRSECGEHDQLSEIFADWIAVQVTTISLKQFSTEFHGVQLMNAIRNSVRDLCEQPGDPSTEKQEMEAGPDLTFHPHPKIRIEKIFGQNPEIQSILDCRTKNQSTSKNHQYCDFEWDFPSKGP